MATNDPGTVTPPVPQLDEQLSGFFYDAFRVVGVTMVATNALERLRTVGGRMGRTIEYVAERKAIEVVRRLQKAVVVGFEVVEDKIHAHKEASQAILDLVKQQNEQIQTLRMRIEKLESLTEDRFDLAVASAIMEADGDTVPMEEVREELGIDDDLTDPA